MKAKRQSAMSRIRSGFKKTIGFLIVVFVLAFVFYHLYSVANFAKNFDRSTGLHANK